jgi:hypothetical protein
MRIQRQNFLDYMLQTVKSNFVQLSKTIPLPNIIKFQYSIPRLSNTIWSHIHVPYLILKIFPKFIFLPITAVFFVSHVIQFFMLVHWFRSPWIALSFTHNDYAVYHESASFAGGHSHVAKKCRTVRGSALTASDNIIPELQWITL